MPGLYNVRTQTSTEGVNPNDGLVLVDATAGNIALTLSPANKTNGSIVTVMKYDSTGNTVTINARSSDTIKNGPAVISTQYKSYTFCSDQKNNAWWIIGTT